MPRTAAASRSVLTSSPSSSSMLEKWTCSVVSTCTGARPPASSMRRSTVSASPRLALVDGVGQLVARDVARLAEVRRQVVGRDPGALAVGGAQRAEQALDAAEILADVAGQQIGGPRLELHRRGSQMVVQPGLAVPRLARRDVDDLAGRADGLDERRRNRPAPADQDRARSTGAGPAPPRPAAARRPSSSRPASRTTTTRRSTRKGGVRQASTTAPTFSSSPAPPPISSTMSAWSPSPTTSSSSPRTAWATSAASSPLTR